MLPGSLVERMLDRSALLSHTQIGYRLRRHRWSPPPRGAVAGRRVLLTGATSGIGRAAAARLAALGASVHVLGHDTDRAAAALAWLREQVPDGDFHLEMCDVSSLADVQRFCRDFTDRFPRLDALVHDAGDLGERRETDEGHDHTLAAHVLGPHLMTRLLSPLLVAGRRPQVVFMTSGGFSAPPLVDDDLDVTQATCPSTSAYARTRRMVVVLAGIWTDRFRGDGIGVHLVHPGWVATPGVPTSLTMFRRLTAPVIRTPAQGADTLVWLLATDDVQPVTGGLWQDRQVRPEHHRSGTRETPEQRQRLWELCEAAVGAHP